MNLHIEQWHIQSWKSVIHMMAFFLILFKVHVIDKKLTELEKRFAEK